MTREIGCVPCMGSCYDEIIELLLGLSESQKKRVATCMKQNESILICLGFDGWWIVESIREIDDITNERAYAFCEEIKRKPKLASTVKSIIFSVMEPDDHISEFIDYRRENLPEE